MLLVDLLVRPTGRPVKLQHEHAVRAAELINAVFVAVQREEPPIDLQADGGRGVEHRIR